MAVLFFLCGCTLFSPISEDFDPLVESLYDGFLKWESSERNLLVDQIMPDEVAGLYIKGRRGGVGYE